MATDTKRIMTHIQKPTEEIKMEAVKRDPYEIKYIENPTKAPKKDYKIKWIENPTETVQLEEVKEKPTEEIKIEAVKQNPEATKEIKTPSRTVFEYLKLTKKENKAIECIKKIINKVLEYVKSK